METAAPPPAQTGLRFVVLTLTGSGGNPELLSDVNKVRALINTLPAAIGMTPISPVVMAPYEHPSDLYLNGVSGIIMIAESHLAIHTFPALGKAWLTLASCREFHQPTIAFAFHEMFNFESMKSTGSVC